MPSVRVACRLLLCAIAGVVLLCPLPAFAAGKPAALHVTLDPLRLGHDTTVSFEIRIAPRRGLPRRLTAFALSYPEALSVELSGLGLAICKLHALRKRGPQACPNESVMGYGTALAEIPYGAELLSERMRVTIYRGPTENGRFELLIHIAGDSPAIAQMTFPGALMPAPAPFGGQLQATLPAVAGLPGGPGVAVISFGAEIGPLHVVYRERVRGRIVSFRPRGIPLPDRCPAAGFVFAARLAFEDAPDLDLRTAVPCPGRSRVSPRRSAQASRGASERPLHFPRP